MSAVDYCICIEELARVCPAIALSVAAHNGLCSAHIAMFGTDEQKTEVPAAARARRGARRLGADRSGRRQRRGGDADDRGAAGRRLGDQRRQDLHHPRPDRRRDGRDGGHRPHEGPSRHLGVRRRARHARDVGRQEGEQARDARERHQRSGLRGLPRAGRRSCSARKGRASSTRCRCSTPAASASPRCRSAWRRAPTRRRAATRRSGGSSASRSPRSRRSSGSWRTTRRASKRRGC